MAQQPHDKTGKTCTGCGKKFNKSMATFTLPRRAGGMIIHELVCKECHISAYQKGE